MKVRIAKTFDFDAAHFLPAAAWEPIHGAIDHRLLNEVPGLENPTTEALAPWILERIHGRRLAGRSGARLRVVKYMVRGIARGSEARRMKVRLTVDVGEIRIPLLKHVALPPAGGTGGGS